MMTTSYGWERFYVGKEVQKLDNFPPEQIRKNSRMYFEKILKTLEPTEIRRFKFSECRMKAPRTEVPWTKAPMTNPQQTKANLGLLSLELLSMGLLSVGLLSTPQIFRSLTQFYWI